MVLGKQGAGKGTQAVRLSRHYVAAARRDGRHLPGRRGSGSEFGQKAPRTTSTRGELVPDEVVIGVVREHLSKTTPPTGVHPRRLPPQRGPGRGAGTNGRRRRASTSRSTWRSTPSTCCAAWPVGGCAPTAGPTTASSTTRPRCPGICDVCGGEVVQRDDDTEDAIRRRLEIYEPETAPLIDWFRQRASWPRSTPSVTRTGHRPGSWPPWRQPARASPPVNTCPSPRTSPLARTRAQVPWEHEAPARRDRQDAQGGPGGSRDAGGDPGGVRPGATTAELDRVAREVLERRGARSNFLNYHGFPAVICTSPNNVIVHGIPGVRHRRGRHHLDRLRGHRRGLPRRRRLHGGYGEIAPEGGEAHAGDRGEPAGRGSPRCVAATGSTRSASRSRRWPRGPGFSVVREYVGHAIGTACTRSRPSPTTGPVPGPKLRTGMVFAVEPMVNAGGRRRSCWTTAGGW